MVTVDRAWGRSVSVRRLLIALPISLLVHILIVEGWHGAGGAQQVIMVTPLQARLEYTPIAEAEHSRETLAAAGSRESPLAVHPDRPALAAPRSRTLRADSGISHGPDTRFYLARDLDIFPVPLVPLSLRSNAQDGTGHIRLWVSIDHTGQVVDVAAVDAEPPGMYEQPVRDQLLVARFDPARKDGRPVKSRVLLALRWGP